MTTLLPFFKALADESRLRLVRLLLHEEVLNVGEMVSILGLAQPSVSQKLGELKRAGLVKERRQSGFSYYQLVQRSGAPVYDLLAAELGAASDAHGDLARLEEVRRARSDSGLEPGRMVEPGRSWVAWARALGFLIPRFRVVDLGCGDGALTAEIAAWAASVDAVEPDPVRLAQARARLERAGAVNVTFHAVRGEELKLRAASRDLVVASHVLHHVAAPAALLAPAHRLLRRGGRLLILELLPHGETWVREKLGHVWLGFPAAALEKLLAGAGFERITVETAAQRASREPFKVTIATGEKR